MLGAQAFSWGGDVALMGTSEAKFLAGVASFFGAHLAYVGAFRALGTGIPAASPAGGRSSRSPRRWCRQRRGGRPHGPELRPAHRCLRHGAHRDGGRGGGAARVPGRGRIRAGAALFLLCDSLIGIQQFLRDEPHPALESAVMATYTAGQWLISVGVRRRCPSPQGLARSRDVEPPFSHPHDQVERLVVGHLDRAAVESRKTVAASQARRLFAIHERMVVADE